MTMKFDRHFMQAIALALANRKTKTFNHAAVGIRSDGRRVHAKNELCQAVTPSGHAEARLTKKLGFGAPIVYVVRINKQGLWRMSKPCKNCERALRNAGVYTVVYTTGDVNRPIEEMRLRSD